LYDRKIKAYDEIPHFFIQLYKLRKCYFIFLCNKLEKWMFT